MNNTHMAFLKIYCCAYSPCSCESNVRCKAQNYYKYAQRLVKLDMTDDELSTGEMWPLRNVKFHVRIHCVTL